MQANSVSCLEKRQTFQEKNYKRKVSVPKLNYQVKKMELNCFQRLSEVIKMMEILG